MHWKQRAWHVLGQTVDYISNRQTIKIYTQMKERFDRRFIQESPLMRFRVMSATPHASQKTRLQDPCQFFLPSPASPEKVEEVVALGLRSLEYMQRFLSSDMPCGCVHFASRRFVTLHDYFGYLIERTRMSNF